MDFYTSEMKSVAVNQLDKIIDCPVIISLTMDFSSVATKVLGEESLPGNYHIM